MQLQDLRKSLLDMSPGEQMDCIMQIRANRRIVKANPKKRKALPGAPRGAKKFDLDSALKGMSKEQLMKILGGMKGI